MEMQWEIARPDPEVVRNIQQHLHCHPITATVLANRGVASDEQADAYIRPALNNLPSPMMLRDLDTAVRRIHKALMRNEKILVFGDYDADGVTATALLTTFLDSLGAKVYRHLPHRVQEGYGLQACHIIQLAVPKKIGLIITVDCGSSNYEAAAAAKRFGIDVIITDHHNLEGELPDATAVINPKRDGQPDLFQDLAGVGVAFFLTIGLRMYLREQGWWADGSQPNLKALCDLVAVGTIADMVPLKGINRTLTRAGLDLLNSRPRPGFQALVAACGIHHTPITSDDIAFRMAPRINAAGRMAHAVVAYNLLNASSLSQANELAQTLNELNQRRQGVENEILDQIIVRLKSRPEFLNAKSLVVADEGWHEGVLGIVASKLVSRYHKPVIVIAARDGVAKGSARSIPQVDLFAALGRCEDLLKRYGGHRLAAGLSLGTENITRLRKEFDQAVGTMTKGEFINPTLNIDCEIQFDDISPELIDELENLAPYGTDNAAPLFMAKWVQVKSAAIVGQRHRRMTLHQPHQTKEPLAAMHFNLMPDTPRAEFFDRLAFRLQWNRYRGTRQAQLVVEAT